MIEVNSNVLQYLVIYIRLMMYNRLAIINIRSFREMMVKKSDFLQRIFLDFANRKNVFSFPNFSEKK